MTKTKKQLRAEAVERLKEINEYSCHSDEIIMALVPADIVVAESNWTAEIRFIIDLLTEEEPPEGDAVSMMRNCSLYEIGVLLHPAGGERAGHHTSKLLRACKTRHSGK